MPPQVLRRHLFKHLCNRDVSKIDVGGRGVKVVECEGFSVGVDFKPELAVRQALEPEVPVIVGGDGAGLAVFPGEGALAADNDLVLNRVVYGARYELLGQVEVINTGPGIELGLQHLGLCHKLPGLRVVLVHEPQAQGRAVVRAPGLLPAIVEKVGAARAFLGDVQLLVEAQTAG